jgi:cell division protein FtsB
MIASQVDPLTGTKFLQLRKCAFCTCLSFDTTSSRVYHTCVCVCTLQEAAHSRELAQWDAQIRARNDELTQLTSENTRCLSAVAEYTRSQMDMEDTLTNTQVRLSICLH